MIWCWLLKNMFAKCGLPLKIWWESFWECHVWRIYVYFSKHMGENKNNKTPEVWMLWEYYFRNCWMPLTLLETNKSPLKAWKVGKLLPFWGQTIRIPYYTQRSMLNLLFHLDRRGGGGKFRGDRLQQTRHTKNAGGLLFFLRLNGAWESCLFALFLKAHTRI